MVKHWEIIKKLWYITSFFVSAIDLQVIAQQLITRVISIRLSLKIVSMACKEISQKYVKIYELLLVKNNITTMVKPITRS